MKIERFLPPLLNGLREKKYDKENEKEKVKETNVSNVPSFPYLAPMYKNFP